MRPPSPAEVETALVRLMETLVAWGAIKVILLGSVARGNYTAVSDIDLIVVKETPEPRVQRIAGALDRCWSVNPPLPVEPLVYRPDEFARLVADEDPLIGEALRHGRILFDQARA